MAQYSIKDLEKVTGIKAHTIRIWEKRYGIVQPARSATNIRSYTDDDLKKLLNISLLNRSGIKISHLAKMSQEEINDKVDDLVTTPEDYDSKIEALLVAMIELDEARFLEAFDGSVDKLGFETTFTEVIVPFMNKAGMLWLVGTINPAQEHFVSNLIRHKLITEIDRLKNSPIGYTRRFLLFLPEGELHELGLLFEFYLLKKHGHQVIYFGQSTPLDSIVEATESWNPDFIALSLVNSLAIGKVDAYVAKLRTLFPEQKILINGYLTQYLDQESHPGVIVLKDYRTFIDWLGKL